MKKESKFQFSNFLEYTVNHLNYQEDELLDDTYIKSLILDICGKALVIMINDKSKSKELLGATPELRYAFFEEKFSKTGRAYQELISKYPTIYQDLKNQVYSYIKLVKQIKNHFDKDRQLLVKKGLIDSVYEEMSAIVIKGDFHNGKAVVEVTTEYSKLIYKPKSLQNDVFFNKFLNFLRKCSSDKFSKDSTFDFYEMKVLNRQSHGWVEFLSQEPVNTEEGLTNYYKRVGYLLSVAYMINLSDLHFENIICKGEYPNIIDLETMFSISMFEPDNKNQATRITQSNVSDSVYSTGMLPILGYEKHFGGDTSGILGGSFSREERVIVNPFRDDIQFKKKVIRQKFTDHIPYIVSSGEKEYCNPYNFIEDIIFGFAKGYRLVMDNRLKISSYISEESNGVTVRILLRNTMEYSLLLQAAKSPLYASARDNIFAKLRKFNKGLNKEIIESEINQLHSLSIPFFKCKVNSSNITDLNNKHVHELLLTPFDHFIQKLEKCSLEDLKQQKKLIRFSIMSQEELFKDGQRFLTYKKSFGTELDIERSIEELVEIIETNAVLGQNDGSINWMNLGVSVNDQIAFESLDNDLYKGLSGIGIALLEYYEIAPRASTKKILNLIYYNVKSEFVDKIENNNRADYSFFNGLSGEFAFLRSYSNKMGVFELDFSKYLEKIIEMSIKSPFQLNDLIAGEAGILIYLAESNFNKTYIKEITQLGKKLLTLLDENMEMASYAHGNSGIMTALIFIYVLSGEEEFKHGFFKLWENENQLKLSEGWKDYRKQGNNFSTYWCHGATGQAIARIKWLELNKKCNFLSSVEKNQVNGELEELIEIIVNEGMSESNFCLCHGIAGNLMVLKYYQSIFKPSDHTLENKIKENFYSICNHGITKGWICGLGTEFYSYGIMTGLSGILYALIRFKHNKNDLGILLPNIR